MARTRAITGILLDLPSRAAMATPVQTARRCTTCALLDSCKKIRREGNELKLMFKKMIDAGCEHHVAWIRVAVNRRSVVDTLEALTNPVLA